MKRAKQKPTWPNTITELADRARRLPDHPIIQRIHDFALWLTEQVNGQVLARVLPRPRERAVFDFVLSRAEPPHTSETLFSMRVCRGYVAVSHWHAYEDIRLRSDADVDRFLEDVARSMRTLGLLSTLAAPIFRLDPTGWRSR